MEDAENMIDLNGNVFNNWVIIELGMIISIHIMRDHYTEITSDVYSL